MKIQPVNNSTTTLSDISKGRQEFNKLSDTEKVVLKACEKARQEFNSTTFHRIPEANTNLAKYIRYNILIEKVMNNVLKNFKLKL